MYAFQKGKKEILAKTKRGITQRYDSFSSHKLSQRKKDSDHLPVNEISNPAKPFFNNRHRKALVQQDVKEISPQHQKTIKYINESWSNLMKDYENVNKSENSSANISNQKIFYYKNQGASTPEFKPFDLESFWGQRLYQNITRSA